MKKIQFLVLSLVVLVAYSCSTSTKITSSWAEPDANSMTISGRTVVLVKIDDLALRRNFEDKLVAALNEQGLNAIPAYRNFSEKDLSSETSLLKRVEELGIGAALALFPVSEEVQHTHTPTVSARVGVPVDFGFGPVFLGANVPLTGGTYTEKIANIEIQFLLKGKDNAVYTSSVSGSTENTEALLKDIIHLVINDMKSKDVIK